MLTKGVPHPDSLYWSLACGFCQDAMERAWSVFRNMWGRSLCILTTCVSFARDTKSTYFAYLWQRFWSWGQNERWTKNTVYAWVISYLLPRLLFPSQVKCKDTWFSAVICERDTKEGVSLTAMLKNCGWKLWLWSYAALNVHGTCSRPVIGKKIWFHFGQCAIH